MASLGMRFFGNLGDWLNLRRVFCCGILLAVEIGVFLFLVAGTHGLIVPLSQPTSTDFVSFYAAGRLADAGNRSWPMTTPNTMPPKSAQPPLASSIDFFIIPQYSCCFAPPLPICRIWWHDFFWQPQPDHMVHMNPDA